MGLVSSVGIATGYGLDGPGIESRYGARFSAPVQTGPGAHPASCTMGTGSFQGAKSGTEVTLTPHPLLVPWSRKSRAISLFPLWAVQPVQSLSVCTRGHFNFFRLNSNLSFFIGAHRWGSEGGGLPGCSPQREIKKKTDFF